MDIFNKYLRWKPFILYTEHKPLENLSHFHNEMLNRLQLALLEHNVIIQYKKGSNMPANYLPRHPGAPDQVLAFDPFQEDLLELQKKDPTLKFLYEQMKKNQWL